MYTKRQTGVASVEIKAEHKASAYEIVPEDIDLHSLSYLSEQDLLVSSLVSRGFHAVRNDDWAWEFRYKKNFEPTPFTSDYKAQYFAAQCFSEALVCSRIDKEYSLNNKAFAYVSSHRDKPWAKYYLGMAYFEGMGVGEDLDIGLAYLIEGVNLGDYRSAVYLANLLMRFPNGPIAQRARALLKEEGIAALVFQINAAATELNAVSAASTLSRMYQLGIGVAADPAEARAFLMRAWEINQTIDTLISLTTHILQDAHEPTPQAVDEVIHFLEAQYDRYHSPIIALELGNFYRNYKVAFETAVQWYQLAVHGGVGQAAGLISSCFSLGEGVIRNAERAKHWSIRAFKLGLTSIAVDIAENIMSGVFPGNEGEAISWLKQGFLADDMRGATKLSELYRANDTWKQDPHKIWWIQAAALCGCEESSAALLDEVGHDNAYACCAAVMMVAHGMEDKPSDLLLAQAMMNEVNPTVLTVYVSVGKDEKLFEKHIENALKAARDVAPQAAPVESGLIPVSTSTATSATVMRRLG